MAYIRWGEELPSGKRSSAFVIGNPDGLVNMDKGELVPYREVRNLFKTKTGAEFKRDLGKRLELKDEELEVVCERLFYERDNGEWDEKFDFE